MLGGTRRSVTSTRSISLKSRGPVGGEQEAALALGQAPSQEEGNETVGGRALAQEQGQGLQILLRPA